MAPRTPKKEPGRCERDTLHRARFFEAYDRKLPSTSFNSLCKREGISIPPSTGRLWLRQRDIQGSPALRRTRKQSSRLGRNQKICASNLDRLIDLNDPIHTAPPEAQIEQLGLNCTTRTLRSNLRNRKDAGRFKKAPVPPLSEKNRNLRIQYGQEHRTKTIRDWWQYVYFTDEAHFNSVDLAYQTQYETRQRGSTGCKRLQPTPKVPFNVTLHVAAGVSYNHKGAFIFYHDPKEPTEKVYKPRRPRKSSVETQHEHLEAIQAWLDGSEHPLKVEAKGNAMTQKFYAEAILPHHLDHIKWLEEQHKHPFIFQEDGDPSHGHRSPNCAPTRLKRDAQVKCLQHPAQSPDLNPIEAVWMIIRKRLRGGKWQNVAEFKAAIEREWRRVSRAEIRRRISEMPKRCKALYSSQGRRYRGYRW